jgi:hypothetical protein
MNQQLTDSMAVRKLTIPANFYNKPSEVNTTVESSLKFDFSSKIRDFKPVKNIEEVDLLRNENLNKYCL